MRIVYLSDIWLGFGGTEATVRNILYEMASRNHEVYALISPPKIERQKLRDDEEDGVTTVTITKDDWEEKLKELVNDETVIYTALHPRPKKWDIAKNLGAKVLHEYNMAHQDCVGSKDDGNVYVFNSFWTKTFYPHLQGDIINPLVDISKFKIDVREKLPNCIGLVNPCRAKGSIILRRLAEMMPDYEFLIAGGWTHKVNVFGKLDIPALPNTRYMGNLKSMSDFYNKIQALLVPTQSFDANWHSTNKEGDPQYSDLIMKGGHGESYGRVVIEAMAHDAAVIASNKDGLPEAVNDCGFLVGQFDSAPHWKMAIERVMEDLEFFQKLAKKRIGGYDYNYDVKRWETNFRRALNTGA